VSGGVVSAPGYQPIVITQVTASSYSNGASSGFTSASTTSSTSVNTQQTINTNLNGDKIGIAGNDIITHRTTTFNPNVKIVINKKSSPGLLKPNGSTNIAPSEPSEVLEVVKEEEGGNSTTFILIAGVIVVLIFVALFVAKTVLAKKVVVAHQRAAELQ